MQDISVSTLRFFVPENEKDRIMATYGKQTFADFDAKGLNSAIGAIFPGAMLNSGYMSIGSWMREHGGNAQQLFDKLGPEWSDMFNIIQSTIRSRKGEKVWYM